MKKLLISLMLFAGCSDEFDHGGICVVEHTFSNTWSCYEHKSEYECLNDLDGKWLDDSALTYYTSQNCDHFCGEGNWHIPGVEGHDCE